jgi:hypothetical protein
MLSRKIFGIASAACLAIACIKTSSAEAIICQGVVVTADIQADGLVVVNYGYGFHSVCNLQSNYTVWRGVSYGNTTITPGMCQSLYSMFLTSKTTGKFISPHYERNDCNIGNWVLPSPSAYYWMFNG